MSLYFNNKQFKIDRVLGQRERNTKIINELARRRNISKAEKGKYKKRKRKTKGKHRKGKKEITIDNQPTQQVKGYSVVNVISAKRGKYKPRRTGDDKRYPDVAPMWFKEGKGAKGTAWKFEKTPTGTGLMISGSDDRYKGDPKQREQLKSLREQVDRIETRLMGGGNLPAQTNQAGPLPRATGRPIPRGSRSVPTGGTRGPQGPPGKAPSAADVAALINLSATPFGPTYASLTKAQLKAAETRKKAFEKRGTPIAKLKAKVVAPPMDIPKAPSLTLSLRSSQKSRSGETITPRSEEAEAKHIGKITGSPATFVKPSQVGQKIGQAAKGSPTIKSPAVSIASRYGNFTPPLPYQAIGRARGATAKSTPAWYDMDRQKTGISTTLYTQPFGPNKNIKLPPIFFKQKSERKGEFQLKRDIGPLKKWAAGNLSKGEARFVSDEADKHFTLSQEQDKNVKDERARKRALKTQSAPMETLYEQVSPPPQVSGGSAEGEIGSSSVIDTGAGVGSSAVLVSPTETLPVPSNINPSSVGEAVGSAASSVASGAGQLGQAVVVGAAGMAGGMLQGVAQQIVGQLPTSAAVGRVIGQGAVIGAGALVGAAGGAISGGYQMINSPTIQAEIVAQPAEPEPEFQGFPQPYVGTEEFGG